WPRTLNAGISPFWAMVETVLSATSSTVATFRTVSISSLIRAGLRVEEQEAEDVVLEVGGLDAAAQRVGRRPEVRLQAQERELRVRAAAVGSGLGHGLPSSVE